MWLRCVLSMTPQSAYDPSVARAATTDTSRSKSTNASYTCSRPPSAFAAVSTSSGDVSLRCPLPS